MATVTPIPPVTPAPPTWPDDLLRFVNAARAVPKLIPYLADDRLTAAASRHGDYLVGPASPALWGSGEIYAGWRERVAWAAFPANAPAGISVAINAATPQGAVNAWMANPADRNAVLNLAYEAVGFGNVMGADGTHYWIAIFGGVPPTV